MGTRISIRKQILIWITGVLIFLGLAATKVAADPGTLSDTEWREDIATVGATIRGVHPRPFRTTDQATFDAAKQLHRPRRTRCDQSRIPGQLDVPGLLRGALERGDEFETEGQADRAGLAYQVGLYFYPDNEKLRAAFELL